MCVCVCVCVSVWTYTMMGWKFARRKHLHSDVILDMADFNNGAKHYNSDARSL